MPSIADILIAQGEAAADRRRRSGERWGSLATSLGQIPATIAATRQAEQDRAIAQRRAALQEQALQENVTAARDERAATKTKAEHEAQLGQVIGASVDPTSGDFNLPSAINTARQMGFTGLERDLVAYGQQHDAAKWKVAADKATANKGAEPIKLGLGDVLVPSGGGQPLASNPKPVEEKPVTYGTPTAVTVNGRKTTARPGSDGQWYIGGQQVAGDVQLYEKPSIDSDPLSKQTEWAVAPGETTPRLMTKEEIRALGAQRPAGSDKPSSGQQKRALGFFNRAEQADKDLEGMESQIQGMNVLGQTYQAWAPNFMQTQLGQQYTQAQRAFTEARLRKDSGAAIPEQEFKNDRQTYFAQPGDSKQTLEQKRRARGAMLASLGFEAGQALGEFLGDADEAKSVVEGYKARAAGKTTAAAPKAPPGWKYVPKTGGGWTAVEDK